MPIVLSIGPTCFTYARLVVIGAMPLALAQAHASEAPGAWQPVLVSTATTAAHILTPPLLLYRNITHTHVVVY